MSKLAGKAFLNFLLVGSLFEIAEYQPESRVLFIWILPLKMIHGSEFW